MEEPTEFPRLRPRIDPLVPQLTATIGLQIVKQVLLEHDNARLKKEIDNLKEIQIVPVDGGASSVNVAVTTTRAAWVDFKGLPSCRGGW